MFFGFLFIFIVLFISYFLNDFSKDMLSYRLGKATRLGGSTNHHERPGVWLLFSGALGLCPFDVGAYI